MTEQHALERQLIKTFQARAKLEDDADFKKLQKEVPKLFRAGKYVKAATSFSVLATLAKDDFDLPLRAAHCYQKGNQLDDAARWFLITSTRYASKNYPTQAIATLRLYHAIKPDDGEGPKKIYELCRSHGSHDDSMLEFLAPKDRAAEALRPSEFFSMLDDKSFDTLLEEMTHHKLDDQACLARMADPATSLFFVISGEIEGYLTFNQKRTLLGSVKAGGICGETAYFTGGRRTAEMIAKGESEVLELPYDLLDSLQKESPALKENIERLYKVEMLGMQLALTPLLSGLNARVRQQIALKMEPITIPAGKTIFSENEISSDLYLVRTGKVAVNLFVQESERLLKTVETGGVIGEISIATNGKRTATARAVSDCTLMRLDGAYYQAFYKAVPSLQKALDERKKEQMKETRNMIKGVNMVEGDDTCEMLLKDIWGS